MARKLIFEPSNSILRARWTHLLLSLLNNSLCRQYSASVQLHALEIFYGDLLLQSSLTRRLCMNDVKFKIYDNKREQISTSYTSSCYFQMPHYMLSPTVSTSSTWSSTSLVLPPCTAHGPPCVQPSKGLMRNRSTSGSTHKAVLFDLRLHRTRAVQFLHMSHPCAFQYVLVMSTHIRARATQGCFQSLSKQPFPVLGNQPVVVLCLGTFHWLCYRN